MTYGHLQADCLTPGSAPGPTLGIEYGEPLPFTVAHTALSDSVARQIFQSTDAQTFAGLVLDGLLESRDVFERQ